MRSSSPGNRPVNSPRRKLHTQSQNVLRIPRIITNPPLTLAEPLRLDRRNPDDHSLVERAVLRALDTDRYEFTRPDPGNRLCHHGSRPRNSSSHRRNSDSPRHDGRPAATKTGFGHTVGVCRGDSAGAAGDPMGTAACLFGLG
jgi:hypothetical protein